MRGAAAALLFAVGRGSAAGCPCADCPSSTQGGSGACCHGGVANTTCAPGRCSCETQNWSPANCVAPQGVWCPRAPTPAPAPTPLPPPAPPTPQPPPPPPPAPRGPAKVVNYIIGDLPDGGLGGTHLILSFLEPSTPAIPPAGDAAWVKYAVATYAEMSGADRAAWMSRMHADGTKVLASLGGAAASHEIYKKYDAAAFGTRAAQYVVDLGLDGLDVDLEGWGNDPSGAAFLKDLTLAARAHFDAAAGGPYVLIHAPEMPDFWHDSLYMTLMADRAAFDAIDFCNVQFYNQIPFPDSAHVFTEDVYTPAEKAPTCLKSIAAGIAAASGGKITSDEANAKLLLGFPYKDGSFPVGKDNLNQGGAPQIALVTYGVSTLGYPLSGVFEWTAGGVAPADLAPWNAKMTAALSAGAA